MKIRQRILLLAFLLTISLLVQAKDQSLLNVSYDLGRELFADYNRLFIKHWKAKTGDTLAIKQSHAGSSKQARAILQGLAADTVTFNQVTDVQVLHDKGKLIPADWKARLPNNSSPYFSTTVFLVRKNNPKHIQSWEDLARKDVEIVFSNPKTSGNGRYAYLAALGFAQNKFDRQEEKVDTFMRKLLKNVKVFDSGGRGASTTFIEREIADVLITFESEAYNIKNQYPKSDYEIIVPRVSILAEFPITWIDANVKKNNTYKVAKEYLSYLYSEQAQRLLAKLNYRVHHPVIKQEFAEQFVDITLLNIEDIVGSWNTAMQRHFKTGAKLDQLQQP